MIKISDQNLEVWTSEETCCFDLSDGLIVSTSCGDREWHVNKLVCGDAEANKFITTSEIMQ